MKFTILVFGCQMNYADSARIKAVLTNCGWTHVETVDEAELVIFDTCSVRQKSEDKVTGKLQEIPSNKKVWITGCMVQHNLRNHKLQAYGTKGTEQRSQKLPEQLRVGNFLGNTLTKEPRVVGATTDEIKNLGDLAIDGKSAIKDVVFINHAFNPLYYRLSQTYSNLELLYRIDDTGFLPLILKKLGYEVEYDGALTNEYSDIVPEATTMVSSEAKNSAFVPISTGCSQFCSYCIVPYARGLEKHLAVDDIIAEVQHHLESGVQEITLLGQIVNKHPQFVEIIKKILALPGNLKWLRYTSPYPTYYSDELLRLHEEEARLCPHIHIPVQSGSDAVLKGMYRGYTVAQFKEFIDKIRGLKREINITTDIIVGFSDETEDDFQQTLELVDYSQFSMMYMGKYSVRPGTIAARQLEDNVPQSVKDERWNRLNEALKRVSLAENQKDIGKEMEMMVTYVDDERIKGYTDHMKNVTVVLDERRDAVSINIGSFLQVKIIEVKGMMLYGEVSGKGGKG